MKDKIIQRQQRLLDEHDLGDSVSAPQASSEQFNDIDPSTAFSSLQRFKVKHNPKPTESISQKKESQSHDPSGYRNYPSTTGQKAVEDDSDQIADAMSDMFIHGNKVPMKATKRASLNHLMPVAPWEDESDANDFATDLTTPAISVQPKSPRGSLLQNDQRKLRPKNLRKKIRSSVDVPTHIPSGPPALPSQDFNIQGNSLVVQFPTRPTYNSVNRVGRVYRAIAADGVDPSREPSSTIDDDAFEQKQTLPNQRTNHASPINISVLKSENSSSTDITVEASTHQRFTCEDEIIFSPIEKSAPIPSSNDDDDYEDDLFEESAEDLQLVSHDEESGNLSVDVSKANKIWSLPSKKLSLDAEHTAAESKQSTGNGPSESHAQPTLRSFGKKSSTREAYPSQEPFTTLPSNAPESTSIASAKYLHGYRSKPAATIRLTKRESGVGMPVGVASNMALNISALPLSGASGSNPNSRIRHVSIV